VVQHASVTARLLPHPGAAPPLPELAVQASLAHDGGGILRLRYEVTGACTQLRIPPPGAPRRADGLWRHMCFEAFVAAADAPDYREFNFSPSGEWAIYHFTGYRAGLAPVTAAGDPVVVVRSTAERFVLDAGIGAACLPRAQGAMLTLALAAVIEDAAGGLSWWASAHPTEKPDFHDRRGFVLELELGP
jgi:hypothetical protein